MISGGRTRAAAVDSAGSTRAVRKLVFGALQAAPPPAASDAERPRGLGLEHGHVHAVLMAMGADRRQAAAPSGGAQTTARLIESDFR